MLCTRMQLLNVIDEVTHSDGRPRFCLHKVDGIEFLHATQSSKWGGEQYDNDRKQISVSAEKYLRDEVPLHCSLDQVLFGINAKLNLSSQALMNMISLAKYVVEIHPGISLTYGYEGWRLSAIAEVQE